MGGESELGGAGIGAGGRGARESPRSKRVALPGWIISCCCCFEGVENDRLLLFCLVAVAQEWTWVWGEEGGGWGHVGPIIMSMWLSLE